MRKARNNKKVRKAEKSQASRLRVPGGGLESVSSSGSGYPDDNNSPDAEPCEVYQYSGPRYPDDSDGPGAVVIRRGDHVYGNGGWHYIGNYSGPEGPC